MAFSPKTGLAYIPVQNQAMTLAKGAATYRYLPHSLGTGVDLFAPPRPPTPASVLTAWDPVRGQIRWKAPPAPWGPGGVLAMAGGLVVQGGSDGVLRFHDAVTGKILRAIPTGVGIMAPPIAYTIDGIQYLAVAAGMRASIYGGYPVDAAARRYRNLERLLVFRLDGGRVPLPPVVATVPHTPMPPDVAMSPMAFARARALLTRHCAYCHAARGTPANGYPDLFALPPETYANFDAIVRDGAFEYAGMAGFSDVLSAAQIAGIKAYLIHARHLPPPGGPIGAQH